MFRARRYGAETTRWAAAASVVYLAVWLPTIIFGGLIGWHFFAVPLLLLLAGRLLRWHPGDVLDYLQTTRGRVAAQAMMQELAVDAGQPDGAP